MHSIYKEKTWMGLQRKGQKSITKRDLGRDDKEPMEGRPRLAACAMGDADAAKWGHVDKHVSVIHVTRPRPHKQSAAVAVPFSALSPLPNCSGDTCNATPQK